MLGKKQKKRKEKVYGDHTCPWLKGRCPKINSEEKTIGRKGLAHRRGPFFEPEIRWGP